MTRLELPGAAGFCVDRCEACGGIWLDASELEKVKAIKGAVGKVDSGKQFAGGPTGNRTARLCPRDGSGLRQHSDAHQEHVVVDRCPTCLGIFLDAGELRDLGEHTLGERIRALFAI